MPFDLHLGDCLEQMPRIPDQSVDLVLCDLPYGTTACAWDAVIPFEDLWAEYQRVVRGHGAIVLTASQPFTTALINSNFAWFKYCWVWEKSRVGDIFNAKNKPLKKHEDIVVFSAGTTANGGMVAAPAFSKVTEDALRMLQVPPDATIEQVEEVKAFSARNAKIAADKAAAKLKAQQEAAQKILNHQEEAPPQ